jgi:predicted Zn-dependent peptidase
MRFALVHLVLPALLGVSAAAQSVRLPHVYEHLLGNGIKVMVVEQPGSGVIHAEVFVRGGRANTGGLPPVAADLLARSLFRRALPAGLDPKLERVLGQEGGAFEALRLDRLAQARQPQETQLLASPEQASLKALEETAMTALLKQLGEVETWDALDALGATGRSLEVAADYLSQGMDLPASALPAWLRIQTALLQHLPVGRFPLERERLLQEIEAGSPPSPPALSVLLATALSGRPYALAGELHRSQAESLTWKDLQGYARWAVSPENISLVLVGDLKGPAVILQLERSLGALPRFPGSAAHWQGAQLFQASDAVSSLESPGGRRLIVSTTGDARVFFGWRVPPANHPDGAALRALTQILGGAPSSRLNQNLVATRGIARRLSIRMGVPGRRDVNLLVIEAEPAEGHSLDELEQAIQDEVLRLQREPLSEVEVSQAQVQLEAGEIVLQEDAATLAEALGAAQCQGGDWRLAFRALESDGKLKAAEIQRAARTYLVPSRATVAQLGPDPLLLPLDRTESRLLQVLTALLQRKLGNTAQAQVVLREALRQLRMLSPAERELTLKLLEAQVRR